MKFLKTGKIKFRPWYIWSGSLMTWGITYEADPKIYFGKNPKPFDYIGLNFYSDAIIGFNTKNFFGPTHFPHQTMGDFYGPIDPEGFSEAILDISFINVPIYITENGMAEKND